MDDKVYIIVLNFNGWHHTIECLESLLKLRHANHQIVVVDNNSSDNSVERIRAWAERRLDVWVSDDKPLKSMLLPTVQHAVPYVYYCGQEAEWGGEPEAARKAQEQTARTQGFSCGLPLVIIQTGKNLGFAGGNNVGMRYALAKGDADYVWLINNDTVVQEDALSHLVEKMHGSAKTGAVGSVHLDYLRPTSVQTIGGSTYLKYWGATRSIHKNAIYISGHLDQKSDVVKMDFVSGCSMLISKEVMCRVGLLDDSYFVYWEDADWSERIKRAGYFLTFSLQSVVFHKHNQSSSLSVTSYFSTLNCFRFYRAYYPLLLPFAFVNRALFVVLVGMKSRSFDYVKGSLRAYGDFLKTALKGFRLS